MKIVLIGEQEQPTMVEKRVENSTNPPMFVDVGGLSNGHEVDTDVLALGFKEEHVGIEFLHRVGFAPEHFGVPAIVEVEDLFGGGGGGGFRSPRLQHDDSLEWIHPNDRDRGVGAHFFEFVGTLLFAGRVQKTVHIQYIQFDSHDRNLHPRRSSCNSPRS